MLKEPGPLLRYSSAVAGIALATLVRLCLSPVLGADLPFITFFLPVVFAAFYGGMGPALLALILGTLSAAFFFIHPAHSLTIAAPAPLLGLALFFSVGLTSAFLCEALRHAQRRAEAGAQAALRQKGELEREIKERRQAEATLQFLTHASEQLASSLDLQTTANQVVDLAVPLVADACLVDLLVEETTIRRIAGAHVNPEKRELLRELQGHGPLSVSAAHPIARVIRTGQFDLDPEISAASLADRAQDAEHLRLLQRLDPRSSLIIPLVARGRIMGALSLWSSDSGRRFQAADLNIAEELARRAAVAIENARLYQAMQEADQHKDDFLAMLGHELRSPLSAAHTTLQLLRHPNRDRSDPQRLLDRVERQVHRMARLIDDMQDLSRINRGKVLLRPEPLDLVPLVRETAEDCRGAAEESGLTLAISLPESPVPMRGDPTRLSQVLVNLLNNAIKFTDAGGQLTVALIHDANWATLTVKDTGIGIEPGLLPQLFESFHQAERSLERSRGGLGLGLALVKGLTEIHGGQVSAHSDGLGRGTEFTVRLPIISLPMP